MTIRSVTVGPFPIYFGNVNEAMGLRGHHHTAQVWLEYGHREEDHGYPSFLETNNELRAWLEAHTGARNTFRHATNEDVANRLFDGLRLFTGVSWRRHGGAYWLQALHLDVEGVQDDIGHDNGTTRYSVTAGLGEPVTMHPREEDVELRCANGKWISHAPVGNEDQWVCGAPMSDKHDEGGCR